MSTGGAPLPRWLEPITPIDQWQTTLQSAPSVGAALAVPDHWETVPDSSLPETVVWRGVFPGEGLVVTRCDDVDPADDLAAWVMADVALVGGCHPSLLPDAASSAPRSWRVDNDDSTVDEHLDVDESRSATGLLAITGQRTEIVRAYVVVARRDTTAWKVTLQLASACLVGTDDDLVDANDHVRARAVLGHLELL
jgi:hypothetical protein